MKIINLTGEPVVVNNNGTFVKILPEESTVSIKRNVVVGIVFDSDLEIIGDSLIGLPDPEDGTIVIVSEEIGHRLINTSYHSYRVVDRVNGILVATI